MGKSLIESLEKVLEKAISEARGADKEYLKYKLDLLRKLVKPVYEKRVRGKKLRLDDIVDAMSITCFGNLIYCCGLERECLWRDVSLEALGIDRNDYKKNKEMLTAIFLIMCGVKWSEG